jgi:hypothetical protein
MVHLWRNLSTPLLPFHLYTSFTTGMQLRTHRAAIKVKSPQRGSCSAWISDTAQHDGVRTASEVRRRLRHSLDPVLQHPPPLPAVAPSNVSPSDQVLHLLQL